MPSPPSNSPTFDLARIFRIKRAIEHDIELACYVGTRPEGRDFEYLVRRFRDRLPGSDPQALRTSLLELSGREITREMIAETGWRLAGNLGALQAGRPVRSWTRQLADEWVPIQIIGSRYWLTKYGRRGAIFQCRVLAGSPCGMLVDKFWTREFCGMISRRLGFSKRFRGGKYPFRHQAEFVGLRMNVLIDAAQCRGEPMFTDVDQARGALLKHNKALIKARSPLHRVCPQNYSTEQLCQLCPIGMDRCAIAVHRLTYIQRMCSGCQKPRWHDPATNENLCIECQTQRMKEQQGHQNDGT